MSEPHFNGPLARWLRSVFRTPPDPWPAEVDESIKGPGATPLCINCLLPQARHQWFCPHCRYPTSDNVPLMPYLQIFMVGEVLRRGVIGPPDRRLGVQVFLLVYSLMQYSVF